MKGILTDHQLGDLADKHAFLVAQRGEIEEQIEQLKVEIGTEITLREVERVDLKQYSVLLVQTPRATLSETLLLEAGVPLTTIEACKNRTVSISVRVNPRKTQLADDEVATPKPKKSHHKKKPSPVSPPPPPMNATSTVEASGFVLPDPQAPEPDLGEG